MLPHTFGAPAGDTLDDIDMGQEEGHEVKAEERVTVVVIDGANVALSHGATRHRSVKGIQLAVGYFLALGYRCFAFVPSHWLRLKGAELMLTEDIELLQTLVAQQWVVLTPPQDHDDLYILSYARTHDGFVVSNDMFRDHAGTVDPAWTRHVVISYTFVGDEFMPNPAAMVRLRAHVPSAGSVVAPAQPAPVAVPSWPTPQAVTPAAASSVTSSWDDMWTTPTQAATTAVHTRAPAPAPPATTQAPVVVDVDSSVRDAAVEVIRPSLEQGLINESTAIHILETVHRELVSDYDKQLSNTLALGGVVHYGSADSLWTEERVALLHKRVSELTHSAGR